MPRAIAAIAGGTVGIAAAVVLADWSTGSHLVAQVQPHSARVVPLTALAFFGLCLALVAGARQLRPIGPTSAGGGWSWVVGLGGLWALGIGAGRAAADLFGWNAAIDVFPLRSLVDPVMMIGQRMSPATAGNFVLLGGALLFDGRRRWHGVAFQVGALTALVVTWLSIGRYLFGGEPLVALAQMALPTTLLFLVSGVGMLCLRPDLGLVRLLGSPTEGGRLTRHLLAPILLVPPFLGWLRLRGEMAGFYDLGAGISLFALSNVIVFGLLVWVAAHRLDAADGSRRQAETQTADQLARMSLLHQITRATAERQDPASIFQVAVRSVEERLPADFALIGRHDRVADTLEVVALGALSYQLAPSLGLGENSSFRVGDNGVGRALGGTLVYEDELTGLDQPLPRKLAAAGFRSVVVAPLQAENEIFGVMLTARRRDHGFSAGERDFLRQLAESVALASQQAELVQALHLSYRDLKEAQRTVVQQERLRGLGEMASGIAHDINNSISPAAMLSDLLLEQEPGLSPEGRSRLAIVRRAVRDVAQTVSRMQELHRRRPSGEAMMTVEIHPLIDQVLELTRSRWRDMPQERGIVIRVEKRLDADLPRVQGVESEIRETLTNLVLNAADAMPEGGLLTFKTERRREENPLAPGGPPRNLVVLEVRDSGVGMDEETRRRCLEPFFTTKGERGSGLGLSMVLGMAERHEAEVEIESAPGQGTAVRLVFPAATETPEAEAEEGGPAVVERLRILVVDDDPILLDTLNDVLSRDGHWVTGAGGGRAGLEAFRSAEETKRPFDLVITDLGMPEFDGRKLAAGVKEMSPATPVVLLTGWGHRMLSHGERLAHVDALLSKPPRLRDLREVVRRLRPRVRR